MRFTILTSCSGAFRRGVRPSRLPRYCPARSHSQTDEGRDKLRAQRASYDARLPGPDGILYVLPFCTPLITP